MALVVDDGRRGAPQVDRSVPPHPCSRRRRACCIGHTPDDVACFRRLARVSDHDVLHDARHVARKQSRPR